MKERKMETVIYDELLQEIFHRLPPSSSKGVPLVSKRWLRLFRSSTQALSLRFRSPLILPSISYFLSDHPYLSSLSLSSTISAYNLSTDHLLLSVAFSCPNLRHLELKTRAVYLPSVISLSTSCPRLISLSIALFRPLVLYWLTPLRSLKDLSIRIHGIRTELQPLESNWFPDKQTELHLRSLTIKNIEVGDYGLNWLWGCCKELRSLMLKNCEGVGDDSSFTAFIRCVKGLQQVELMLCTPIFDSVLLTLAENCVSLESLVLYDCGIKRGLIQFLVHSRCRLKKLDLTLPIPLVDDDLIAMANTLKGLSSLRLRCSLHVTGEGLKTVVRSLGDGLEEFALIDCHALYGESGILTTLGQDLRNLKVLDLSYNKKLIDSEISDMLVSCRNLKQLTLRGCNWLTDAAVVRAMVCCKQLEIVDFVFCSRISAAAVELCLMNSGHLRQLHIEESKISVAARTWASSKYIEIVHG